MEPVPSAWSPRPLETAVALLGGLVVLLLALLADPAGRLLLGVAALGLLVLGAADLLLRPRLAADPAGVQVRTLASRHRLPWSAVERVEVEEHTRYGLTSGPSSSSPENCWSCSASARSAPTRGTWPTRWPGSGTRRRPHASESAPAACRCGSAPAPP